MQKRASPGDIFLRCLFSKCPVCGKGRLFVQFRSLRRVREFFLPVERCDGCDFCFGRQPGYYLGVITPILPLLALMMGVIFAGFTYIEFSQEVTVVLISGAVGAAVGFFLFFRTAIAVYVALDHVIDPPSLGSPDLIPGSFKNNASPK